MPKAKATRSVNDPTVNPLALRILPTDLPPEEAEAVIQWALSSGDFSHDVEEDRMLSDMDVLEQTQFVYPIVLAATGARISAELASPPSAELASPPTGVFLSKVLGRVIGAGGYGLRSMRRRYSKSFAGMDTSPVLYVSADRDMYALFCFEPCSIQLDRLQTLINDAAVGVLRKLSSKHPDLEVGNISRAFLYNMEFPEMPKN